MRTSYPFFSYLCISKGSELLHFEGFDEKGIG